MKKIVFALLISVSLCGAAQGIDDAVLFSQQYYQATAKSLAMGGAVGAVGADLSAASINPAGLGLYRRSGFSYSMGSYENYSKQSYNDIELSGRRNSVPFNGFGMVFTFVDEESDRFQMAMGINRLASFGTQKSSNQTFNLGSSLIDNYMSVLDGIALEDMPYRMLPAWNTYLIDTLNGSYVTPMGGSAFSQSIENSISGSLSEFYLSFSGSLSDRHYIGITMGIPFLGYKSAVRFSESAGDNSWNYRENITDAGAGVNFKMGYIYYPASWLRLGLAWHSRSYIELNDSWFLEYSSLINSVNYKDKIDENSEYVFIMPARYLANAALVFGKSGMLTFDYELVNYRGAKFGVQVYDDYDESSTTDYSCYADENAQIKKELRAASNLRVGVEWCAGNVRFRGGVGYFANPYKKSDKYTLSASSGIGFNFRRFALDFAYVNFFRTSEEHPVNYSPAFRQVSQTNQFVATLCYKFSHYSPYMGY